MVMINGEDRLKAVFKHGSGDLGFSKLLDGETEISKGHVACTLFSQIESCQQAIGEAIFDFERLPDIKAMAHEKEIVYSLCWYYEALFGLSSFCWCRGDSQRYLFPVEAIVYVEERSKEWQKELGDCADFLKYKNGKLLRLNKVRIEVREVEGLFTQWWECAEMSRYLRQHPALQAGIQYQAGALNRLSTYFHNATRLEAKLLGVEETPWAGAMPKFTNPSY